MAGFRGWASLLGPTHHLPQHLGGGVAPRGGTKSYVNGDYYGGQWRCNLQDCRDRYVCDAGNRYVKE